MMQYQEQSLRLERLLIKSRYNPKFTTEEREELLHLKELCNQLYRELQHYDE